VVLGLICVCAFALALPAGAGAGKGKAKKVGEDPHGAPRGAALALQLISDFLQPAGAITNVCGASPCYAGGYTGPGP
jgi:hypothetical protein